jgi:hypothetical protein
MLLNPRGQSGQQNHLCLVHIKILNNLKKGLYPEAPDAKDIELEHLEFSLPPGYMDDDLYE